jgi:hypothetical protein
VNPKRDKCVTLSVFENLYCAMAWAAPQSMLILLACSEGRRGYIYGKGFYDFTELGHNFIETFYHLGSQYLFSFIHYISGWRKVNLGDRKGGRGEGK